MPNVDIPKSVLGGNLFICDNLECGEIHVRSKSGKIKPLRSMRLQDWSPDVLEEFGQLTQAVVRILKHSLPPK